jgi:phytoene dehydrogenase-like protein
MTLNGGSGYDAIVVGAGHNGLTTAGYLARAGMRVCLLERREIVGGACVTEEIWPGHRVSRASYVVSLLQPKVVRDLRLHDFGYEAIPLDPAFATMAPGGRPIFFWGDAARTSASIEPHSPKDAAAYPEFEALLGRLAEFLRPLMLRPRRRSARSAPATCSRSCARPAARRACGGATCSSSSV